jgi:hypothetical protein
MTSKTFISNAKAESSEHSSSEPHEFLPRIIGNVLELQGGRIRIEPFVSIALAAKAIGQPRFKLYRAARARLFPVYVFGTQRKLVRISEVIAAIEASHVGGSK